MPITLLTLAAALALAACGRPAPDLPDLATLPDFTFEDQDGQALSSASLRGRPWVANFLFTSCPTACPPLAAATTDLQGKLKAWVPAEGTPPVQLVSFTIDPATDTPERLREYGARYQADPRLWRFARSDYETTERLVTEGFLQPLIRDDLVQVSEPTRQKALLQQPIPLGTAHSLRFVLVDQRGHLRGVYDRDPESLDRLHADLRALAEAAP